MIHSSKICKFNLQIQEIIKLENISQKVSSSGSLFLQIMILKSLHLYWGFKNKHLWLTNYFLAQPNYKAVLLPPIVELFSLSGKCLSHKCPSSILSKEHILFLFADKFSIHMLMLPIYNYWKSTLYFCILIKFRMTMTHRMRTECLFWKT